MPDDSTHRIAIISTGPASTDGKREGSSAFVAQRAAVFPGR